jgi:HD-GYP domain-containing protein (c-di-GMP phosphodiesterase class II)
MAKLRQWLPWVCAGSVPIALFALMREGALYDPTWIVPNFHFFVVSLTSLIALFLASLMAIAAGQIREARVVFLSLAFLAISGLFAVHGLTTPGALFEGANPWVGFSARLALFLGAAFFAASSFDHDPHFQSFVVRQQRQITVVFLVMLLAYGAVAFVDSSRHEVPVEATAATAEYGATDEYAASGEYGEYDDHAEHGETAGHDHGATTGMERQPFAFLTSPVVADSATFATIILLLAAIIHYGGLYARSRSSLLAGVLLSAIFLVQAQISMSYGTTWQASWWQYHVLMLAAFVVASLGIVVQYGRIGSVNGVIEGLLARTTIERLQSGYTDVIVVLVGAVEAKDVYTRGHTQRVSELALRIGADLRLSPDRLRVLGQAAMLHDIGKIAVPDSILNKPGRLTDDEFAVVKQHPVRGYEMVKDIRSLQPSLAGIRHHHERLDGSGYPDALSGDAIALDARIIAVADVFDALTSQRSYRDAWAEERAIAEIERDAGSRLDAACVASLKRVLAAERATHAMPAPAFSATDDLYPAVATTD